MSTVTTASATREHRVTTRSLATRKRRGQPFTMLTAYDFTFARIFDEAGVDVLLVGDSLGNVVQGHDTTLPVTLEEVGYHTRMVARGVRRALVVADMPFGSFQVSPEDAVRSAIQLVKEGGAHAVKLEGGAVMEATIRRIVAAQIPVMGHVGLTPQSVNQMGGYRVQGRGDDGRHQVMEDALAVEAAGAFAVVLEGIPAELGREVTERLDIPTIGIGAGVHCDAQVLVMHDLLGLNDWTPSFVKQYANLGALASTAARAYVDEVEHRKFPDAEHSYR
jgi:3-methyl-2-oxobutanoate hydroxymethyltransferase